jgi:hypothetical protein
MRMRMASFSALVVAAVFMLGGTRAATAQQLVKFGDGQTLTISGFISATMFYDSGLFGSFGQGQNAEVAAAPGAQPATDKGIFDGDVRNTRINFTFNSTPVLGKWSPRATLEADFFGAFPAAPAPPFSDEQPQMRIRFAFVDLSNGRTTVRIGQFWSPMFGEVPVSLTHLAFPLGYGATGMVGWRFPGVFLYQDLSRAGAPLTVQLQLAALKGSGPAAAGSDVANNIGNGEASGLPQFEARLNFAKKTPKLSWSGYVVGHVDWKDTTGTGRDTTSTGTQDSNLSAWGFEAGANIAPGKFTLHGNFYYGKALGQQFAHITQQGNIRGWGAWAQAGYDFTPHWSLWAYTGMDQPNVQRFAQDNPTLVLPRQLSHDYDALLRFRAGRYAVGLEYFRAVTRYNTGPAHADQVALSVLYTL